MRTPLKLLVLALVLLALGTGAGFAGDKLHVGLYLAENELPPPGTQPAPEKLHRQLEQVFGFHHYRLLKEQEYSLRNEWPQWFMGRKDFFLRLEPLHRQSGEPKMVAWEIYQEGFFLVKGTYEPHEDTPLFLNGPYFHRGMLILVIQAR